MRDGVIDMQKIALVLGGGGSRGSYQIGVWQALRELDIQIDIVTGTSVGALNAALITMNDFENALALWKQINTTMVLDVDLDETLPTDKKIKTVLRQFMVDYAKQGGTDTLPLKNLLKQYAIEEVIRKSNIELGIVVFGKRTLKPHELYIEDIKEGQLIDYLLASSSIYPAVKSCKIDDVDYIDGGYYDNIPVELAINKGADRIFAVDLEAIGIVRKNVLKQAKNLTVIKSYWNLGPILVFENDIIMRNIRLGYLDTMKAMNVFDGIAFTFVKNDINAFIKRNKATIDKLHEVYGILQAPQNRTKKEELLYLKIASHYKHKYGKEITNRYSAYFKACMETAGELFELDYTKIYSVEKFNEKLAEKINQMEVPFLQSKEYQSKRKLKQALSLLDKKVRALYLAVGMKQALAEGKRLEGLALALFLPDELLAAYYLALLD